MWRQKLRCRADKGRREQGFTLIELSIVVLILGLILTISALNIANISRGIKINAAKKQIESALVRARTAARQENVSYRVIVYPSGSVNANSYEFLHNELVEGAWQMIPANLSVSGEKVIEESGHWLIELDGNVNILGEQTTIEFNPVGTIMNVSPATISLGSGSHTVNVSIDSLGKVTIN